jgi:hypothetical protein
MITKGDRIKGNQRWTSHKAQELETVANTKIPAAVSERPALAGLERFTAALLNNPAVKPTLHKDAGKGQGDQRPNERLTTIYDYVFDRALVSANGLPSYILPVAVRSTNILPVEDNGLPLGG